MPSSCCFDCPTLREATVFIPSHPSKTCASVVSQLPVASHPKHTSSSPSSRERHRRQNVDVLMSLFLRREACNVSDHLAHMSKYDQERWTQALCHRRRELGDNSTRTGVTFDLNPSQLPGVAPSPGVSTRPRRSRPGQPEEHRQAPAPPNSNVSVLERYINASHSSCRLSNLTLQRPASPVDPPTVRGSTSEGQLCQRAGQFCHAMKSRRKRTIVDDASWATTQPVLVSPLTSTRASCRASPQVPASTRPRRSRPGQPEELRQAPAPPNSNVSVIERYIDALHSSCRLSNLRCATPRFPSRPTNRTWMDERGPALPRHGEQEEAHHCGRRELGDNSTRTGVTFDLNPSQLLGVAPPQVMGCPPDPVEAAQDNLRNAGRRQHPQTAM